ncbi:MAG TPA: ABC transporter substrate-binding protein [Burkholderiales bacterium]|nr:ABC transporter substrate-binding protein [Burkholderiales bacterium]
MRKASMAAAACFLAACSSISQPPPAAVSDLAPTGKLRAAINVGNPILAARDPGGGDPRGVSVDLARELGRRLGVPVQFVVFDAAGKVVEAGRTGAWDVAFVALDPARAAEIAQSPPYVVIEGAYLVRQDSALRSNDEVDRKGNRVVVGRNSAYDLYLTRSLKQAEIVRAPTSPAVVELFLKENHEVAAGVKQQLEADARRAPGLRLLPGRFMVINQAMASQRSREAGARYVRGFIEEMKATGFVAKALEDHKVQGAAVAPAGDAR